MNIRKYKYRAKAEESGDIFGSIYIVERRTPAGFRFSRQQTTQAGLVLRRSVVIVALMMKMDAISAAPVCKCFACDVCVRPSPLRSR
jgi:hypothetical protein